MLAHRQWRWTNIETTLGQIFVFAGRAVRILIHACRLCLVGTGSTVLCVQKHMITHLCLSTTLSHTITNVILLIQYLNYYFRPIFTVSTTAKWP